MQESFLSSTKSANIVGEYLVRVQIPTDKVSSVLSAISKVSQLKYGNYEQVAFRYNSGTQQFKPAKGSKVGGDALMYVPSDEVSWFQK